MNSKRLSGTLGRAFSSRVDSRSLTNNKRLMRRADWADDGSLANIGSGWGSPVATIEDQAIHSKPGHSNLNLLDATIGIPQHGKLVPVELFLQIHICWRVDLILGKQPFQSNAFGFDHCQT